GVSGVVRQVLVKQGDPVTAGQILAVLSDPEAESQAQMLSQQLAMANSAVRSGQFQLGSPGLGAAIQEQRRLQEETAAAQVKVAGLTIRAPFPGIVSTPGADQKAGQYLSAGDEFCELADRSTLKARILVRDWELEDIHKDSRVELKVRAFPYRTFAGTVDRVLPAAAEDRPVSKPQQLEHLGQQLTNYIAVEMVFPNPDSSLTEGMTGSAKIGGKYYPVAWQAGRSAWRWARSQIW
ncbi:MAG TPA: HlyD family efflux transporter periplasmic adaptor subunit, partial [Bryobacteraceae bacterium]|nr:HlyD family efflux transporter periplasmic adaptor subunit [Bryobacteraceae bacterium]